MKKFILIFLIIFIIFSLNINASSESGLWPIRIVSVCDIQLPSIINKTTTPRLYQNSHFVSRIVAITGS